MRNSDKPIPFGCFLIIALGVFLYFMLKGDSPEEKKEKEEYAKKIAEYKSRFDYNIDSLCQTLQVYNYEPNPDSIKKKCLILEEQDSKYVINLKRGDPFHATAPYPVPDSLVAYNLKDLNTIIIQKFSTTRTSPPPVSKEQVELLFYDVKKAKVLHKVTVVGAGNPYVSKQGRDAGRRTYFLPTFQVVSEIIKTVEHQY